MDVGLNVVVAVGIHVLFGTGVLVGINVSVGINVFVGLAVSVCAIAFSIAAWEGAHPAKATIVTDKTIIFFISLAFFE